MWGRAHIGWARPGIFNARPGIFNARRDTESESARNLAALSELMLDL